MATVLLTAMQMNRMVPGVTSTNRFYEEMTLTIGRLWIIDLGHSVWEHMHRFRFEYHGSCSSLLFYGRYPTINR